LRQFDITDRLIRTLISIETLTANANGHNIGDVVYHIPEHTAERIQDLLGMNGLQDTQRICQGQSLKRSDPTQDCVDRILRQAMDLADIGPQDLLALAQANIPVEPGPGQPIGFPIPNISVDEFLAFLQVYRRVFAAAHNIPEADQNWDPIVLYRTSIALTIASHAAMFVGQSLLDIYTSPDDLVKDLRKEDLACAKDLVCLLDNCQGQKEIKNPLTGQVMNTNTKLVTPICLTVSAQSSHSSTLHLLTYTAAEELRL
jgi:hypothetical protein